MDPIVDSTQQLIEHGVLGAIIVLQWVVIKYLFDKAFGRIDRIGEQMAKIEAHLQDGDGNSL